MPGYFTVNPIPQRYCRRFIISKNAKELSGIDVILSAEQASKVEKLPSCSP
jgi:hypothetical protein